MQRQDLVDMVRASVRLQEPNLENDPAYKFSDEIIESIVEMKIPEVNDNYTLKSFPKELEFVLMVLCRKEIYWRLATSSAPLYPISAEGAKLDKNVRFDHYIQLIKLADDEYNRITKEGGNALIETGEIFVEKNYYTARNKLYLSTPKAYMDVDNVYTDKVEVSWEIPHLELTKINDMKLYISESPVVDMYNFNKVSENAKMVVTFKDPRVSMYRLVNLKPLTKYYIALEITELNLNRSVTEIEVDTLGDIVDTIIPEESDGE